MAASSCRRPSSQRQAHKPLGEGELGHCSHPTTMWWRLAGYLGRLQNAGPWRLCARARRHLAKCMVAIDGEGGASHPLGPWSHATGWWAPSTPQATLAQSDPVSLGTTVVRRLREPRALQFGVARVLRTAPGRSGEFVCSVCCPLQPAPVSGFAHMHISEPCGSRAGEHIGLWLCPVSGDVDETPRIVRDGVVQLGCVLRRWSGGLL